MTDDNKALLLASAIFYSIAALIIFLFFCCTFGWALMTMNETYDDDEEWLNIGLAPCTFLFLPLAMALAAAVCSGLLYKQ